VRITRTWNSGCYRRVTQAKTESNLCERYIRINKSLDAIDAANRPFKNFAPKNTPSPIAARKGCLLIP
jgi:hypothetical protein